MIVRLARRNLASDTSRATVTWVKCKVWDAECRRAHHWAAAVSRRRVRQGESHLQLRWRLPPSHCLLDFVLNNGASARHVAVPHLSACHYMTTASPLQWLQHNLDRGDANIQACVYADHVVSKSLNLHFNPQCSSHPNLIPQIPSHPPPLFLPSCLLLSGRCCRRCTAAASGPSRRPWSQAAAWSGPGITSSTLSPTAPASTSGRPWTSWSRFGRTVKGSGWSSERP